MADYDGDTDGLLRQMSLSRPCRWLVRAACTLTVIASLVIVAVFAVLSWRDAPGTVATLENQMANTSSAARDLLTAVENVNVTTLLAEISAGQLNASADEIAHLQSIAAAINRLDEHTLNESTATQGLLVALSEGQRNASAEEIAHLESVTGVLERLDGHTVNESSATHVLLGEISAGQRNASVDEVAHLQNLTAAIDLLRAHAANESATTQSLLAQVRGATQDNAMVTDVMGRFPVALESPLTAFGEVSTVRLWPLIQSTFAYNTLLPELYETRTSGVNSSCACADALATCRTGSGAGDFAVLRTRRFARYRPGMGVVTRFTARFDTPVAGAVYLAGPGDAANGFFFGYSGTTFGIMHRRGGRHEIWRLTFTTAATGAGTVTFTLAGVNYTAAVTNAGGATQFTAFEVARASTYGTNGLWAAFQVGAWVEFQCTTAADQSDTMAFFASTTGAVAAFTKVRDGRAPTETWVPQSAWSVDRLDGIGHSNMTLDPTRGNVYQVQFQWLGFGAVYFGVERDTGVGKLTPVHILQYANRNNVTSVEIPSFPLQWSAASAGSTTPLAIHTASASAFVEGEYVRDLPIRSIASTKSISTETNILCVRATNSFNGVMMHSELLLASASFSTDGARTAVVRMYYLPTRVGDNTTAGAPRWTPVSATTSLAEYDTTSSTTTGGAIVASVTLGKADSFVFDFAQRNLYLEGGRMLCISGQSPATNEITATVTWHEIL